MPATSFVIATDVALAATVPIVIAVLVDVTVTVPPPTGFVQESVPFVATAVIETFETDPGTVVNVLVAEVATPLAPTSLTVTV